MLSHLKAIPFFGGLIANFFDYIRTVYELIVAGLDPDIKFMSPARYDVDDAFGKSMIFFEVGLLLSFLIAIKADSNLLIDIQYSTSSGDIDHGKTKLFLVIETTSYLFLYSLIYHAFISFLSSSFLSFKKSLLVYFYFYGVSAPIGMLVGLIGFLLMHSGAFYKEGAEVMISLFIIFFILPVCVLMIKQYIWMARVHSIPKFRSFFAGVTASFPVVVISDYISKFEVLKSQDSLLEWILLVF